MKPAIAHKVTVSTRGGNVWAGRFVGKPTRKDVVAAIQYGIDAVVKNLGKKCGDIGYYTWRLREALEIMANAPSYFAMDDREYRIEVGATLIGTIQTLRCTVYIEDAE
jgi:hypothetical protein